jgi:hypothetical protein
MLFPSITLYSMQLIGFDWGEGHPRLHLSSPNYDQSQLFVWTLGPLNRRSSSYVGLSLIYPEVEIIQNLHCYICVPWSQKVIQKAILQDTLSAEIFLLV